MYGRLHWDKPAQTINVAPLKLSYIFALELRECRQTCSSGTHLH